MSKKVLVIASNEASREPAYIISKVLSENGHSMAACNAHEESDIIADVCLSKDTSLDGYEGLVFVDDGGYEEAALSLAKKADHDMAIGGLSADGCLILASAGKLKKHHVCAGLPEEACTQNDSNRHIKLLRSVNAAFRFQISESVVRTPVTGTPSEI